MKLPWNIDSAMCGVLFMYIGFWLKKHLYVSKVKTGNLVGLIAIGSIAALKNNVEYVSLDSMIYGNVVFMLLAAVCLSLFAVGFVFKYIPHNTVFEYLGRNTIPILGFNYLINDIIDYIGGMVGVEVVWYMQLVFDLILIIPFIWLWNGVNYLWK